MPGILPMKVIKVGNSTQSRIAQACDRCRSKKIRCDGVRPCCTQCANVGFECKTSDKLSRRAFPRGYTESLEERVRSLEAEVRDLKNLLDEKDEKIDVLSRIHSFTSPSQQKIPPSARSPPQPAKPTVSASSESVIHVPQPQMPGDAKGFDGFGVSSTRGFADVFTTKLTDQGRLAPATSTKALTASPTPISPSRLDEALKTAPRLVSDQLINIFFQEWAPLYPVVHRPTILKAYEQYLSDSESFQGNRHDVAQLNLIFAVAALSATSRTNQDPSLFEDNWSPILESMLGDISIHTLQCYVLAQMYCLTKGDYSSLLRYRSLATGLCHQLRLHQSQKAFSSNPLLAETRKKVFWCQYVVDRFCAGLTGLPVLLREQDIRTEYPEDIDDENVTATGFLPTLPGESTRISSALALFNAARILNNTLENIYPSDGGYEIPLSKMRSVAEKLEGWVKGLPTHLRLEFSQDKPSTNVISSRSPLLSLVYYFIRSLLHRPAICFGDEQTRTSSALAIADSSKHIVQILQLLDERRLCLSVAINRRELVSASGLGLLWLSIGLKRDSKLVKESQRMLAAVIEQLESESSAAAAEFSALASVLVSLDNNNKRTSVVQLQEMSPPLQKPMKSPKKQIEAWKARLMGSTSPNQARKEESISRRNTISGTSPGLIERQMRSPSWASLPPDNYQPHPSMSKNVYHRNSVKYDNSQPISCSVPTDPPSGSMSLADWEFVVSDMDQGYSNIFTGIYGGKECGEDPGPFASLTAEYMQKQDPSIGPLSTHSDFQGLSPEAWSATSSSDFAVNQELTARSVYSDESLGSRDDSLSLQHMPFPLDERAGSLLDPLQGVVIPAGDDDIDEFGLVANGWNQRLAV
ncbi:Putative Acetate regulatory DNA binding protein FacB [Aspergillus calidoustus]|uniref:Putative Acetate regulatory DNA binding protein FacB n=1 Tax=Aspergillus calidoustus TaxID=454130 RepID=A0A0U5GBF4_ASPCI|nr:Putative Acetate regulatory DNA binding protein FacB [Aspergillus calidoustus]